MCAVVEGWEIPGQGPEHNSFAHISLSDGNVTHARPWWHRIVSGEGLHVPEHKSPLAPSNPTDSSFKSVITFKDYRHGTPHPSPTQAEKGASECQLNQSFQGTASGLPASLFCATGPGNPVGCTQPRLELAFSETLLCPLFFLQQKGTYSIMRATLQPHPDPPETLQEELSHTFTPSGYRLFWTSPGCA